MGKPEKSYTEHVASFYLDRAHKETLTRISARFGVPRSALVRRLIEVLGAYHDHKDKEEKDKT